MADMPSHHQGEGSDLCRPEKVGVGRCLGTSLHDSLMDRSQLVHMVALVRSRTGVHEREHSCDQQGRLVVGYRIWTGKYRAGLTVFSLTVAEEERIGSRIIVSQLACLADEAS